VRAFALRMPCVGFLSIRADILKYPRYSILIQPVLKIGLGLSNTRRYAKNFSLVIAPEKMPSYPKAHPIKLFKRNCHIPLFFVLTEILLDLQMRMIIICILRVQSYYETN
jgi:hypothetical protein